MADFPLLEPVDPAPDVAAALRAFADWPDVVLLDSARQGDPQSRYSFLTADPFFFQTIRAEDVALGGGASGELHFSPLPPAGEGRTAPSPRGRGGKAGDPLRELRQRMQPFVTESSAGLPPFVGGAVGLLSYDLGRAWERLPAPQVDEFQLPALAAGLYDWCLAWDHLRGQAWIISQGYPETDPARRRARALTRIHEVREALSQQTSPAPLPSQISNFKSPISPSPAPGLPGLTSNFSRDTYLRAVERAIEYIRAGDIFQVNLSQRLLFPLEEPPLEIYLRLRARNAAPFAGYFAHDDWVIASASPERFVCVVGDDVETRPIKGTRQRKPVPEADLFTRDELRESGKDQAENVMIVDLLRNDLSRVCLPGTLRVPGLCRVETYETVQHLVSEVRGRLRPGKTAWDLFPAAFPGGSITGAPKVRAMQIIAELEPTARGPYCGSLFYIGFDGRSDSSILIRTFTMRHGWIQCPVGGGIVAQSDPASEYAETLHKAEGMLRALRK